MKYIIFKGHFCDEPVIFSKLQSHKDVAEQLSNIGKPVSAGFVDYELNAYGKSTSLNLESRPQDTEIIDIFFMGEG